MPELGLILCRITETILWNFALTWNSHANPSRSVLYILNVHKYF